ncbi:MAG: iron chelate uptake ABC transporter family permease subunit, partial [Pseudoalteromonas sp.]|nr:iron chelate uptake ABC transporter family permease subunit [Pseudoalteromonas sp.]
MLLGVIVLLLSDWLARLVVMPAELPIGIITALLGAPLFIYLIIKNKRDWS